MAGYQLKITIEYTKPPVWRRIIVPEGITFENLHDVIQAAFGWENMHLHDFSFPKSYQPHIGPAEGMANFFSDDLDETEVYLDEYIKNNSWIRYIYDFGDDWRHKIILEKELPDYKEQYPQIIKYKGNNFSEDCGGVWGEEEIVSTVFNLEEINAWMKQYLVFKKGKKSKKKSKRKEDRQVLAFDKIGELGMSPENFLSAIDQMVGQQEELSDEILDLWEQTLEDFKNIIGDIYNVMGSKRKSLVGSKMGQIGLLYPGEEDSFLEINIEVKKEISKRSQKEMLMDFQKDELQENMDGLGIYFAKSWKKEKLVTELIRNLEEHPEYLYYLLNKQEFSEFLKFVHAPEGSYHGKLPVMALKNLVWWGYMDVKIHEEKVGDFIMLIPQEVEKLVKELEKTNWKRECSNIEKAAGEMSRLMQYYGCIELDKFYEKYTQALRPLNREDYYKYLYFAVDGHDLAWLVKYDSIEYLCLRELDIQSIMECRETVQELDYPDITRLDIERWKRGLGAAYPEWNEFAQYLDDWYGFSQDDINNTIVIELCPPLLEGADFSELSKITEECIPLESLEEWVQMWKYLHRIFLHTRISGLKGYTREELAEKKGVNPFTIAATEQELQNKSVETSAHFYETPLEYQKEISEILKKSENSPRSAIGKLKELMMKYNREHYESRFLLAELYRMNKQWDESRKELKSLIKDYEEDEDLEELLELWQIEDGEIECTKIEFFSENREDNSREFSAPLKTFRREEKKIGRNDSCPCGSGKKYKFCCGKNK